MIIINNKKHNNNNIIIIIKSVSILTRCAEFSRAAHIKTIKNQERKSKTLLEMSYRVRYFILSLWKYLRSWGPISKRVLSPCDPTPSQTWRDDGEHMTYIRLKSARARSTSLEDGHLDSAFLWWWWEWWHWWHHCSHAKAGFLTQTLSVWPWKILQYVCIIQITGMI